jgi:adenine-specific DNA-methyltransferase
MKLKQAILSVMGRDALKAAVDELEIESIDRRSVEEMRARLSRTHRATPELLIERLSEAEVKVVCELIGVDSRGRRSALVESLLQARPAIESKSFDRTDVAQESEHVRWMRPEEVEMTEQPTDKPEVQNHRDPDRLFEITRTELVWPGKYDERGKLVEPPRVSLPFQVIEVIEEGRTSRETLKQAMLPLFGEKPKGPAEEGWRNKLIWGDNLHVLSSLTEFTSRVDLIYIDPPFDTGSDFSFKVLVGGSDEPVSGKERSSLEEVAYRDTWGKGSDSYLQMMRHRLLLMRDLLAESGSIFIHLDVHTGPYVKLLMDEIFGRENFQNEIAWYYYNKLHDSRKKLLPKAFDQILYYVKSKSANYTYTALKEKRDEPVKKLKYRKVDGRIQNIIGEDGKAVTYISEDRTVDNVWRIRCLQPANKAEWVHFETQKPVDLVERILSIASKPDDLVLDCFAGSGTTLIAAEKMNRRWIGCDLGRFAIHTTRKRLLDLRVKDPGTGEERGCRPFEVLNLGKYERKYWQGITFGNEPRSDEETALAAYVRFILELYKAQPVQGGHIHGRKGGAFVHVGAVDAPVTISQIEDASAEAQRLGGRELHILGWEFEMGLHDPITQYVRAQHGVIVRLLSIPRETMEKRAVEAGDVQFFDLAYLELEIKPEKSGRKERTFKVVLKDFVIPSTDLIPEEVRAKIRKWSDYIDYWAVDWDFRNDTFVNQWQTYRTRQNRSLALETPGHTYDKPGAYQILVKVVDIFGNDTSHLVRWEVK